ncbi:hypothetical protein SAMN05421780_110121 [Flexibacter flexilis DSM 6793]|uniref:40-residue YVTN family beta-propeller repeat-containing protein n=1 Tax=Flexibacter flexilis DSM 6793 TaxID=927664 RepID=A0A1I1MC13_9BACT|nr:DUF5074 domain-containing protein [Flexibacter flexilis]SFC82909.1 hypothetical protein SAMN05421780_110121 [Flexibacter flexilis DSM 6793]
MQKSSWIYIFSILAASFWSCEESTPSSPKASGRYQTGVWITNEGNFLSGDGSVSFFHTDSNRIENEVFNAVNGRHLGDVVQSMTLTDAGKGYIVVNNSKKIEVINALTGVSEGVIQGFASPRYMVTVGQKAYVSDLYADKIWVVNLDNLQIIKNIPVSGWTEKLALVNGKVYVASRRTDFDTRTGGNLILEINPNTDTVTDSLSIGKGSGELVADAQNRLWTFSLKNGNTAPALLCLKTQPLQLLSQTSLASDAAPTVLTIKDNSLYFLGKNGVYKTNTQNIAVQDFISQKKYLFYGLGVSPTDGKIYVSDAIDYQQQGYVFRYSPEGAKLDSFRVGKIPSSFTFTR